MRRRTTFAAAAVLGFAVAVGVVAATVQRTRAADTLSDVDRKILETFTKSRTDSGMVFHWDEALVTKEQADAAVLRNRGFYAEVEEALGVKPSSAVHVFLHRDLPSMQTLTGAMPHVAAYSSGQTIHQTHDYGECHEFVHVFAQHLPKDAESVPPEGFFVEGLATALQARDKGIAISTWAAVYAKCGRLPPLVALRRTWPEGAPAGVHPYHVAGSFIDFAIQRFGMEKVLRLYTHCLECQGVLGTSFAALETEWRTWLAKREVPAEDELFVLRATGLGEDRVMPSSVRERRRVPLWDGTSLSGWKCDADDIWSVKDGVLVGATTGAWSVLATKAPEGKLLGVRLVFRMVEGSACKVRMNDGPAGANEAIFAAWKTYFGIAGPKGFLGAIGQDDWRFTPGLWHEAILVTESADARPGGGADGGPGGTGTGRVYADGLRAIEVMSGAVVQDGRIGIGVEAGKVEVASVEAILAE